MLRQFFIAALVGALFPLHINPAHSESEKDSFRVGAILILSGEGSSWGTASKNGLLLAAEDLNKNSGVLGKKVELFFQDDESTPSKSITAFRQLTESQSIQFIIGPTWSNLGIPLINMANLKKTVMISPSLGMAKFNESSPYLFNTWPHDYILSENLADYVWSKGHKTVAVIGAEDVWVKEQTISFSNRFESLGGKIAYLTEPLRSSTDLRTEALKIKSLSDIDAVIFTTDGVLVGSLAAKALKEIGVNIPQFGLSMDQAAIDASQGGYEGLEFLSFLTPESNFQERYEKQFNIPIEIGADSAYDALMLLAKAITEANSFEPEKVAAKLSEQKSFNGVSGLLTSDGKGGFVKDFVVKRISGGRPVDRE